MKKTAFSATILAAGLLLGSTAMAQTMRVGMQDDPDTLDPHMTRAASAMYVMRQLCDTLIDLDAKMNLNPSLATSWTWSDDKKALTLQLRQNVKFHDGTPFDAEAVKFNIERAMTLPETQRKGDSANVAGVDVTGPHTAVLKLKNPDAAVIAKLAELLGTMISPTAAKALGAKFGGTPSCSGPFKFVERVAQDRIVLERFADYWGEKPSFERVIFRTMPDGTVRLANIQAGALDLVDRLDPTDVPTVQKDARLKLFPVDTLNYQSLVINVAKTPRGDHPMGRDARVREAFDWALDRKAIVDVAFAGQFIAGNQFVAPDSPFYDKATALPQRDVEKAKKILKDAGYTGKVPFEITVPNRPITVRVAEMIQAMTNEAGFDTKLKVVEFATSLNLTDAGDFQAWGPIGPQTANDPDAVTFMSLHTIGNRNVGKFSSPEMDKIMEASRLEGDPAKRRALYQQAGKLMANDRSVIYLYHQRFFYVTSAKVTNLTPTADGFVLLRTVKLN